MSKLWENHKLAELEKRFELKGKYDNLTGCQSVDARQSSVAMEGWDLRWEIERLEKLVAKRDAEITTLRFDVAMLKAELNSVRGKR